MKNLKNKYILYLISFFEGLVFYGAFATIYRLNRGIQLSDVFLLESIFVILMMVFELPWGIIGDKIGYRKTLIISFGLFLLSKIAFYYAHSFSIFLLEAVLGALAISGISGCDSAILYLSVENEESDKVFGRYNAFATAGFLISSLLSGFMVKISLDLLAFATIIAYVVVFILSFFLKEVKDTKHEKRESVYCSFKTAISNKKILVFVILLAIIGETTHSVCVFLNQPLYIKSGIDMKWFGVLTAFMQISTFIAVRAHNIKNKIGTKKIYIISIGVILITNIGLIFSHVSYITILLIFLMEGAFAVTQPITETIKNESIKSQNRATILSSYAMVANVISALCNGIISIAAKQSMTSALIIMVILNFIVFMLLLIWNIYKKRTKHEILKN